MKKWILILPVLLLTLWLSAQNQAAADIQQAENSYREGKYAQAAEEYNKVLLRGFESSDLYYNLGNCFYKLGDNTKAILNYERALLLKPGDSDTRYNLKIAQKAIVDKIEVLPELFLLRWYKAMTSVFSADQWAYASITLFILFLAMVALFFYSSSVWAKKTGFFGGCCVLLFTVFSILFAVKQNEKVKNRDYAILVTPSVTVKGAPDTSGTSLFVVHEGLKVQVIGMVGDWYNIRLADGNEGWIQKSDLEKI